MNIGQEIKKIPEIELKIAKLESRLYDNPNTNIFDVVERLNSMAVLLETLEEKIKTVSKEVKTLKAKVTKLEKKLKA